MRAAHKFMWTAAALMALTAPAAATEPADLVCQIDRVVDGDTAVCDDGQRLRFWGFNAPERDEPCGAEATEALAALIADRRVRCLTLYPSWRRQVAVCKVDGIDVGTAQVRAGWGTDWPDYSGGAYAAWEAVARANRAGQWGGCTP